MRQLQILVTVLVVVSVKSSHIERSQAEPIQSIGINSSQVRPLDPRWARLPAELRYLRQPQVGIRIVNGQEATPSSRFSYQAYLEFQTTNGGSFCGGSILSSNAILTAAHCVYRVLGGFAIVGAQNRTRNEPSQQRIPFAKIYYHIDYNEESLRNDVAIVLLSSRIRFNYRVQPVRLPTRWDRRLFAGYTGTVSGFGKTCDDCGPSDVLLYTSNKIMTNAACYAAWPNPDWIQQQNLCLSTDGDRASCRGDSGGPLVVKDGRNTLQVGIVSFARINTCVKGFPGGYARVTYYLDWILHVMTL